MIFVPFSLFLLLLFILLLPLFFFLIQIEIVKIALSKLGLSPGVIFLVIVCSLIGSLVNIPLHTEGGQVISINVGGAVIPLLLCVYLIPKAPALPTIFATIISTLICFKLSRVAPGLGVTIPAFIPPLAAVLLAFIFSPSNKIPVAFISGVLGVLIGADLLNLPNLAGMPGMMSIGGAGVYDGIFLVGIISALLA